MGDAEVHDLCAPVLADADIGRLDVSMHDAALVSECQSGENVDDDVQSRLQRKWLARLDQMLEIYALDELHRDEEVTIGLSQVVDAHNIRVLKRSGRLRLVQKTLAEVVLPRDRIIHHLDCDGTVEDGILRPVDDAHRALAYELDDAV